MRSDGWTTCSTCLACLRLFSLWVLLFLSQVKKRSSFQKHSSRNWQRNSTKRIRRPVEIKRKRLRMELKPSQPREVKRSQQRNLRMLVQKKQRSQSSNSNQKQQKKLLKPTNQNSISELARSSSAKGTQPRTSCTVKKSTSATVRSEKSRAASPTTTSLNK